MWADLPADVLEELRDPRYSNRTHYRKATSAEGCHGPLCRKAERDAAREKTKRAAEAAGRTYRPVAPGPARARDAELDVIIAWHEAERAKLEEPHCASCACNREKVGVA